MLGFTAQGKTRFFSECYCSLARHLSSTSSHGDVVETKMFSYYSCLKPTVSHRLQVTSPFKPYYLGTVFYKVMADIKMGSSGGLTKYIRGILEKNLATVEAIRIIRDSWKQIRISILIFIWKKLLSTFMHNFSSLKTLVDEEPTDMVEPQKNRIRDRI